MSIECEKSIIATAIEDNSIINDLYGYLEPKHFSININQDLYQAILETYSTNSKVDLLLVSDRLKSKYDQRLLLDTIKDYVVANRIYGEVKIYASIIIQGYKEREYTKILSNHSYDNVNENLLETVSLLNQLSMNDANKLSKLSDHVKVFKEQTFNKDYEQKYLHLGFQSLDYIIGGIDNTDIVVIGARPSVGKSALVSQIIVNALACKLKIVYYSLEMSERQTYQRLVSNLANIELDKVRFSKYLDITQKAVYDRANKLLEDSNVFIRCQSGITVSRIKRDCMYISDLDFIIIDYLQLMKGEGRYNNRTAEVGEISKSLKALSMELKVPIILLSQLNRVSTMTATKEPTMAELRESGDIEQDASIVIILWNLDEDNKSKKGVKVEKNRNGNTGKMVFNFYGQYQRFVESNERISDYVNKRLSETPKF